MTNRGKINQMSNKELAELLSELRCSVCPAYNLCNSPVMADDEGSCIDLIKLWLESEVEK